MLGLKVTLEHAQKVKEYLLQHDIFDKRYAIAREDGLITFPVIRQFNTPFDFDVDFIEMELDERQLTQSLKDALKSHLTEAEQQELVSGFDIVGSIAIIEVPDALLMKEQLIGEKILQNNRAIKTVLKKVGGHQGVYRTQAMALVAGEDTRETTVMENGVRLKVNVETAYYSVRMSTERARIAKLIKPGERVMCLFSGVGPYPIVFSKHTPASEIVGIEINPAGHELAVENVAKNRCLNVRLLCGDAHEIMPKLDEKFDRFTMPLPHTADEFLDEVLALSHPGTVIHFYAFLEEGAFNTAIPKLREMCARHGFVLGRYDVIKVGQHSPRVWRICIDAEVAKE
jgi:tRNA (guanine37-N1)-methyltransferase